MRWPLAQPMILVRFINFVLEEIRPAKVMFPRVLMRALGEPKSKEKLKLNRRVYAKKKLSIL